MKRVDALQPGDQVGVYVVVQPQARGYAGLLPIGTTLPGEPNHGVPVVLTQLARQALAERVVW